MVAPGSLSEASVFRRFLVLGLLLSASLAWPLLSPALHFLLAGVSPQRPSHSFFVAGEPMPVEARMLGVYGGFAVAVALLLAFRPGPPAGPRPKALLGFSGLAIASIALDGGNAFLSDLGMPHLYLPSNLLRLITGTWAGMGLGLLLLPAVARLRAEAAGEGGSWKPVLGSVLLAEGAFVGAATSGVEVLAGVAAVLGVLGVVGVFWALNGALLALLLYRSSRVKPGLLWSLALAMAVGALWLLALLRFWVQDTFGVFLA